ncbi:TPA: hypothetical protein NV714_003637 [Escherichia coli]|nr:hypothetical protein [Escherichia coli]
MEKEVLLKAIKILNKLYLYEIETKKKSYKLLLNNSIYKIQLERLNEVEEKFNTLCNNLAENLDLKMSVKEKFLLKKAYIFVENYISSMERLIIENNQDVDINTIKYNRELKEKKEILSTLFLEYLK